MRRLLRVVALMAGALVLVAIALVAFSWAPDRTVAELAPRWAPPPSKFVAVAGMQVHVRDEGPRADSLPLVLMHGTSASLHTWNGWTDSLSKSHRVIRFDLPGFGLTGPMPGGDYTMAHYVVVVSSLLDSLHLGRVILAGNSFGGEVAVMVTRAQPDRVAKLILVDAAGYPMRSTSVPLGFRLARSPLFSKLMLVTLPRAIIESSVRNVYGNPSLVTPELVDRYYELTLRAGNRQAVADRFRQSPSDGIAGEVAQLKLPTLILWGSRDRLIPPENAERFHHDIAGSTLVIFDGLGHVPHEEDPARTVAVVRRFLGR
ncbi:MAG: alpha/beta hydrolase [Gemmatimonadetes bacterium]|nr:alpha/beta hydrolase [Gemmatimonadota bacterium]